MWGGGGAGGASLSVVDRGDVDFRFRLLRADDDDDAFSTLVISDVV